jgi:DNA-binding HxlR family transcriptional regulator
MRPPVDSVEKAVGVLSDRWTFLVLREAFFGVRRFGEMLDNLGIARNILADRLKELVEQGILVRRKYQDRPERFEYRLTEKGRDVYPIVLMIMRWGDRWLVSEGGPPLVLYHERCGNRLEPVVVCSCCGEEVDPREVRYGAAHNEVRETLAGTHGVLSSDPSKSQGGGGS